MITTWYALLFSLIALHNLCDYPLQGDFLAQGKNRNTALGKLFWPYALSGHAFIHGGAVFLATGSVLLGVAETLVHALTDFLKCETKISMFIDQAIHYGCKVLWVVIWVYWI